MRNLRIILITALILLLAVPMFALRQIRFKNYWIRKAKSVTVQNPIVAYVEDNDKTLHLRFLENLGKVTISVKDSSGNIVYDQSFDALNESSLVIPLLEQKGDYVLSISNEYNNVEGEFDI